MAGSMADMMRDMASAAASASSGVSGGSGGGNAILKEMMRGMAASTGGADSPKAMEEMSKVWSHMNELMEKDPKAYGEFLEQQQLENARTEAQAALNDQLGGKPGMFPEPGFVLKTTTRSTRLTAAPPRKTFVNIVQHKHVLPPTLPSNEPVVDKDGKEHAFARTQAGSATVSMAVGHVRAMVDNKGEAALVVDVLVHPWSIEHAARDKSFRKGLVELVNASVLPELNWASAEDPETGKPSTMVEICAVYKGGMPVPGFEKAKKHVITMKFLVHDTDRPAHKTHADCSPTALPQDEATERAKHATGEAIKLAATAAGGEEARGAIESLESAKAASVAASATAARMESPSSFLAQARANLSPEASVAASSGLSSSPARGPSKPLISVVSESAAAIAPSSTSAAVSIMPLRMSVLPPVTASGRIELLLSGVVDMNAGQSIGIEVQTPDKLRVTLPGRAKKLKVTIPQASLNEAVADTAPSASARAVLVGAGSRVKRASDGKIRLVVSVVWD